MDLKLTGRTPLIIGESRGIGKAIARELSGEGVAVAISGRTQQTLEDTAKGLEAETEWSSNSQFSTSHELQSSTRTHKHLVSNPASEGFSLT